tara:strand:- start:4444 stop:4827 length:384 start_codon:yes stop_codon:yes gene_type:complete
MFMVGLLQWWYGRGWLGQLAQVKARLGATLAFFSISQLTLTLFAPFRQISAGRVKGSLAVHARAFFDMTISRVIGAIVRLFTIVFGLIVIATQAVIELVIVVFWLFVPLFPIIGLLLFAIGWVPAWM